MAEFPENNGRNRESGIKELARDLELNPDTPLFVREWLEEVRHLITNEPTHEVFHKFFQYVVDFDSNEAARSAPIGDDRGEAWLAENNVEYNLALWELAKKNVFFFEELIAFLREQSNDEVQQRTLAPEWARKLLSVFETPHLSS